MAWNGIVRLVLVWAIPVILLIALRLETSRHRTAKESGDGKVLFELDQRTYWAWLALFIYLLYAAVIQFGGGHFRAESVVVAVVLVILALLLIAPFPVTIIASAEGLTQEVRFWLRKKKIAWSEVKEVRKVSRNRSLMIVGADGTKIVHTRQLPDRDRLLEELVKHCGDKVPAELRPVTAVVAEMVGSSDSQQSSFQS